MRLGFTGTRQWHKITAVQKEWVWLELDHLIAHDGPNEFHHGGCVGADALAHDLAIDADVGLIVVHKPENTKLLAPLEDNGYVLYREPKAYLDRNQDIVNETQRLIAVPSGEERQRSGTWATIRYAIRMGKPVTICYPDGTIEKR